MQGKNPASCIILATRQLALNKSESLRGCKDARGAVERGERAQRAGHPGHPLCWGAGNARVTRVPPLGVAVPARERHPGSHRAPGEKGSQGHGREGAEVSARENRGDGEKGRPGGGAGGAGGGGRKVERALPGRWALLGAPAGPAVPLRSPRRSGARLSPWLLRTTLGPQVKGLTCSGGRERDRGAPYCTTTDPRRCRTRVPARQVRGLRLRLRPERPNTRRAARSPCHPTRDRDASSLHPSAVPAAFVLESQH